MAQDRDGRLRVVALSMGGTISMSQDASGRRASLGADGSAGSGADGAACARSDGPADAHGSPDAGRSAGGAGPADADLLSRVDIEQVPVANVGSASVEWRHLRALLAAAHEALDAGADAVVVTHGTDSLEESAFLLDLLWDREEPLVLTGAMRPANAPGADGPANIRDAIRTALSPAARGLGVLVAIDGEAHLAREVVKVRSQRIGAFSSEPSGPVGVLRGDELVLRHRPMERPLGPLPAPAAEALPRVAVVALGQGDDASWLADLPAGAIEGLVVAGVGTGHVAADAAPRLGALVSSGVPVVVATRILSGGTSTDLYAYPGAEVDLIARGCVMAGLLSPQKARLQLQLLLASGADREEIAAAFA